MPFLASGGYSWPPTASMTSEVKNNYAYVVTQDICNKFIEVNFCVGCMVSKPNRLLQRWTIMALINKIMKGVHQNLHSIDSLIYRQETGQALEHTKGCQSIKMFFRTSLCLGLPDWYRIKLSAKIWSSQILVTLFTVFW